MRKRSRSIRSSRTLTLMTSLTSVFPRLTSRRSYVSRFLCHGLSLMRRLVEWKCGYQQFRRGVYERAADPDASARTIDCTRPSRVQWLLLGGHMGAGNMNGASRSPTFVSVYTVLPPYSWIPDSPSVGPCAHIEIFVSLPYTLCDITSRSRPVLTIQRALLFLVDREAVPLMTLHLSVPSSARESVPRGRRWCRIRASSRGPPRVYGSGCCWPITAPRSPEG